MNEPNLGGFPYPVVTPVAPAGSIPRMNNELPRADAWRTPVSPVIEVVDNSGRQASVVGTVQVSAPHRPPGGYDAGDAMSQLPAVSQHTGAEFAGVMQGGIPWDPTKPLAPPVSQVVGSAAGAPTAVPPIPVAMIPQFSLVAPPAAFSPPTAQLPLQATAEKVVEFDLRLAGVSESIEMSYLDVIKQDDLLVFVGPAGRRLWLPGLKKSGEIVENPPEVAVGLDGMVHVISVLPVQFSHAGYQYGLAIVLKSVAIQ